MLTDLWRRWLVACTLGELIGFGGIPVLGGALAFWLTQELETETRSMIFYVVAVVGGLGEGAVLAWFQARVLTRYLERLSSHRWIVATALAASFAWACGMLAPTLDDVVGISTGIQIAIWIPAGILILFSIATAQAWVLRGLVERPQRWVTANVLGWLAGLSWTFLLPALLPENAPIPVWVCTFVIGGVLMGLTVGAVTGFFLLRFAPARISTSGAAKNVA